MQDLRASFSVSLLNNCWNSISHIAGLDAGSAQLRGGCGLIAPLQLPGIVRQTRIPNLDPDLVQPDPDVLEAVPSREQRSDFWPGLPDLARLGPRLFPNSGAELIQFQRFVRFLSKRPLLRRPREKIVVTPEFQLFG